MPAYGPRVLRPGLFSKLKPKKRKSKAKPEEKTPTATPKDEQPFSVTINIGGRGKAFSFGNQK